MKDEKLEQIIEWIETEKFHFGQLRKLWFSIEARIQGGRRKTKPIKLTGHMGE